MSIASRIQSIEQHLIESYEELEGLGIDTSSIDNNLENIPKLLDGYWETLPKVTGEGTSITLNDTKEAKMKLTLNGNTYQNTTEGKNLNVYPYETGGNGNGITFTINNDGTVVLNGTNNGNGNSARIFYNNLENPMVLEAGRYYMIPPNNTNIVYVMTDGTNYYSFNSNNGYSQIFNSNIGIKQFYVQVAKNNTTTFTNEKIYPMLATTQVTQSDWEEYTGKQPSPNPNYPQNVEVVTGTNNIEVCGKNLFNKSSTKVLNGFFEYSGDTIHSSGSNRVIYIKCQPNTTYSFRQGTTTLSNHVFQVATTRELPAINVIVENFVERSSVNNYSTFSYTTNEYAQYIVIRLRAGDYNSTFVDGVQIERNDTPTTYEAYQGTTYPVNLGNIELCKISTYQDRIYKQNGKWYLEKQIGKVILNGTQDLTSTATNTTGYYRFMVDIGKNIYTTDTPTDIAPFYCNKLSGVTRGNTYSRIEGIAPSTTTYSYKSFNMYINAISQMTIEQANSWLSQNNIIVYYPYATPTTTEITSSNYPELYSQLNALNSARSYNEQTNINQENSNESSIISVRALEEI